MSLVKITTLDGDIGVFCNKVLIAYYNAETDGVAIKVMVENTAENLAIATNTSCKYARIEKEPGFIHWESSSQVQKILNSTSPNSDNELNFVSLESNLGPLDLTNDDAVIDQIITTTIENANQPVHVFEQSNMSEHNQENETKGVRRLVG